MANSPLTRLVHELAKLPTVGEKTALRLALHVLRQPPEYAQSLARALEDTVREVGFCSICHNIATGERCDVCATDKRRSDQICVVEDVADVLALERAQAFRGTYHVLHGALSPIDGVGPDELKLSDLKARIERNENVREVILATNPNVNGDATALYVSHLLKPIQRVRITRLASGIPIGSHIEFIDQETLAAALERRSDF